jgi:hypothetical protein
MPTLVESAPRRGADDASAPNAKLLADAAEFANAVARVWPPPHRGYFEADLPRRALAQLVAARAAPQEARALAEPLETWSLKRIAAAYLPDAPPGLVETLRKLDGEGWSPCRIRALSALLADGGEGMKTLRHAPRIEPRLVAVLGALPPPLRRPRIVTHVPSASLAELLARGAKRVAHEHDGGAVERTAQRLERARSTASLFRMLIEEIGLEKLAPPPIPGAEWFVPIASVRQIESAALRFQNCLRSRIPAMLAGRAAYYEVVGPDPAVVEIVRDAQGLWVVGEVEAPENTPVSPTLWARIRAYLEQHGARTYRPRPDALALALAQAADW